MVKIAIIEDDKLYNEALTISFQKQGYEVISGFNANDGRNIVAQSPDIVVLDIGLPDGSGIDVCRFIQGVSDIPVVFLTAKDEETDMIEAYDSGCDDYVVKPFPIGVLQKKIDAVLKRNSDSTNVIRYRELEINIDRKRVTIDGDEIKVTAREYRLLELLAQHKGNILSKNQILEEVWDIDGDFVDDNTVNVTINRLRKKIEPDYKNPVYITNVFGMGYRFGE